MSPLVPLRAELLTLFPPMVEGYLSASILGKAREKGLLEIGISDIRDFASGKHQVTDDAPYGGGAGHGDEGGAADGGHPRRHARVSPTPGCC